MSDRLTSKYISIIIKGVLHDKPVKNWSANVVDRCAARFEKMGFDAIKTTEVAEEAYDCWRHGDDRDKYSDEVRMLVPAFAEASLISSQR